MTSMSAPRAASLAAFAVTGLINPASTFSEPKSLLSNVVTAEKKCGKTCPQIRANVNFRKATPTRTQFCLIRSSGGRSPPFEIESVGTSPYQLIAFTKQLEADLAVDCLTVRYDGELIPHG